LNRQPVELPYDKANAESPYSARLMPIPGKKAGDETNFDFAFFAQSKVMKLDSAELNPPFN
jgi:hypothetical protein